MATENEKSNTEFFAQFPSELKDGKIRLIGIPSFGLIIPHLTGLFGALPWSHTAHWWGYIYFILISFLIWHGNRYFLLQQRRYYDWFNHPVRKLILLLFANVFYTAPLTVGMLLGWYALSGLAVQWNVIELVTLMCVICVIFITHVYETVYLIQQRESDRVTFEKLQRAKAEAELEALKTQIDPHFMFNSLNTLSYLIEHEPKKALLFNESLADVYRYILLNKDKEMVFLRDELEFLNHYYAMMKIRFGESIRIHLPDAASPDDLLIPPISLQILLENAVKHNELSERRPLNVDFELTGDTMIVRNPVQERLNKKPSSRIGLKLLSERFELIMNRKIEILNEHQFFTVKLPLLRTSA